MKGVLYMIPSSLSETTNPDLFSPTLVSILENVDDYIVEKTKTARRFIKALVKDKVIDNCIFQELNKHTEEMEIHSFLAMAENGKDMAMISEAGCPGIADPGAAVVRVAHERNIRVIPIAGPSSIYMALMASGLNGQHFQFHGYLDKDQGRRIKQLKDLEREVSKNGSAQIFMETPFRNKNLFEDLMQNCSEATLLCIARNISEPQEIIQTKSISDWKKTKIELHKEPCIFILGR